VVNIGDLLMRWTNDRWISNTHRVVNPPATAAARAKRLSIAFFHQPNYNALIGRCGYAFPANSLNQDTPFGRLVQRVGAITSVPHWADCTIRSSEFDFDKAQEELKWNPITILRWA
jgi:hypothetical protein